MKKLVYLFVILSLIIIPTLALKADNSQFSDINNFTFKAEPVLGSNDDVEVMFSWKTNQKMEKFRITLFSAVDNSLILDYDSTSLDTDALSKLDLQFYEVEPVEEDDSYYYRLNFIMKVKNISTIKMLISYSNKENHFTKSIFLPIGTAISEDPKVLTKNAIYSAIFAAGFAIIATLIIIITSQYKTIDDENGA